MTKRGFSNTNNDSEGKDPLEASEEAVEGKAPLVSEEPVVEEPVVEEPVVEEQLKATQEQPVSA
jgi:hypothetical protein